MELAREVEDRYSSRYLLEITVPQDAGIVTSVDSPAPTLGVTRLALTAPVHSFQYPAVPGTFAAGY